MAGFLDDQTLLTASSLGADAEDYDVTVLSNGDVLVGYFSRNSGPMSMYTYDVKSDSSGFSSGLGQSGFSPMNDPNVVTLANGGYGAVVQRAIGNLTTDKRLVYQKYNADGTEDGALIELDSGFVTDVFATTTSKGFFVAYEQRTNDDFVSGSFYNANGKLLKQIDLTADLNVTTSRIDAASLSNGNVAVVMGSDFQIFSASGATVGNLVSFADQLAVGNGPTTASVAAKDGGFMISYGLPGDIDVVRVQQYDNQG
jgi:hypothetical protein